MASTPCTTPPDGYRAGNYTSAWIGGFQRGCSLTADTRELPSGSHHPDADCGTQFALYPAPNYETSGIPGPCQLEKPLPVDDFGLHAGQAVDRFA